MAKASQDVLTKENINVIVKKIVEYVNNEKDIIEYKQLTRELKLEERKKNNLLSAIAECESAENRKILFSELDNIRETLEELNNALLIEKSKHINLGISEVKFFLNNLKKGNIDNINYKKRLIDTLVNKVYLYDDRLTILFNINNHIEEVDISLLKNVESSLLGVTALPFRILKH